MDFRQAVMQDLPQLKDMYKRIIKNMNEQNKAGIYQVKYAKNNENTNQGKEMSNSDQTSF